MWLLLAFVAVPLIEIALFIQIGGAIGLWPTLAIVLITAIAGSWLVRSQGARELANMRSSFSELRDPTEPLANGAMILFAGALLLTPGFFTDIVGFALLLPPVRAAAYKALRERVNVQRFEMGDRASQHPHRPRGPQDRVIDGEYEEVSKPRDPNAGPSRWSQDDTSGR
ncbi:FxsA family protein [Yoonia sp. 208BN28-4]|uniref:FxsA family protein n=1 Tax=Yoonia sp. 208BN28-4 TaxID=3126505 RepID=UPI0030AE6FBB